MACAAQRSAGGVLTTLHQIYQLSAAACRVCHVASHVGCSQLLDHKISRDRRPAGNSLCSTGQLDDLSRCRNTTIKYVITEPAAAQSATAFFAAELQQLGRLATSDRQSLAASLASAALMHLTGADKMENGWQLPYSSHSRSVCLINVLAARLSSPHTAQPMVKTTAAMETRRSAAGVILGFQQRLSHGKSAGATAEHTAESSGTRHFG